MVVTKERNGSQIKVTITITKIITATKEKNGSKRNIEALAEKFWCLYWIEVVYSFYKIIKITFYFFIFKKSINFQISKL